MSSSPRESYNHHLAVILPHPTEAYSCAITAENGALPNAQFGPGAGTRERAAQLLAREATGNPNQGVDAGFVASPNLVLYVMKKRRRIELADIYEWHDFSQLAKFANNNDLSAADHRARRLMLLHSLMNSIKSPRLGSRHHDAMRRYFGSLSLIPAASEAEI